MGKPSHFTTQPQIKATTPAAPQMKKQPVAPAVYRPQPIPKVLQRKSAAGGVTEPSRERKPVAPPAYRPQPVPKVLQTKKSTIDQPANQSRRTPAAPAVYRPQPVPKVLQAKEAHGGRPPRQPVAPPAYRPEPKRIVQPKINAGGGTKKVIQRLIVVDQDLDTSRLLAAVDIYNKWLKKGKPERLRTMKSVELDKLEKGEKLYLVAHGDDTSHGDRSAQELAALLRQRNLKLGETVIKLISCNTGDGDDTSFAAELAKQLGEKNKVVGIRGLEATNDGHTRGHIPSSQGSAEYDQLVDNNPALAQAEKVVERAKAVLKNCKPEEEEPILLQAAKDVQALVGALLQQLEEVFKKHVTISSKADSEYVHLPKV